jgi:hypothetical protein
VRTNVKAQGPVLEEVARADGTGLSLLRDAADAMQFSARGYHRILRVARTLADLDGADKVGRVHFAEALSYRALADDGRARTARSGTAAKYRVNALFTTFAPSTRRERIGKGSGVQCAHGEFGDPGRRNQCGQNNQRLPFSPFAGASAIAPRSCCSGGR